MLIVFIGATLALGATCAHNGNGGEKKQKTASATLRCGSLQTYHSELGRLNLSQQELGQVFYVPKGSDTAQPIARVEPDSVKKDEDLTTQRASLESELEVTVNAGTEGFTNEDRKSIKAKLQSLFETKGSVEVISGNVRRIPIWSEYLHGNNGVYEATLRQAKSSPDSTFFVVHNVTEAESMELTAKDTASNSLDLSVDGVGSVNVAVDYECSELVEIERGRAFFKATPIKLSSQTNEDGRRLFVGDDSPEAQIDEISFRALSTSSPMLE
jgi:hypothetical protein